MTATLAINNPGVFTDEVYTSTDLSRRASEVLNRARTCPVTISRNGEQFALLRREQAAELFSALATMKSVVIFLSELHAGLAGRPVSESFAWLNEFEKDDLEKLSQEVSSAMQRAACGEVPWAKVEDVIYEWRESGLVARSGVLDHALFIEKADESPIPAPDSVSVEAEAECPEN